MVVFDGNICIFAYKRLQNDCPDRNSGSGFLMKGILFFLCSAIFPLNFVVTPTVAPIKSNVSSGFAFIVYNGIDFSLVCFTACLDFLDLAFCGLATATDVDGFYQGDISIFQ